jgi:hypothetical protein
VDLLCELNARKEQNKRGKYSQLCQQHGPKLLAKLGFPHQPCQLCQLCQQLWARLLAKLGSPEARADFANSFGPCCWQRKLLAKLGFFANS